MSSYRGQIDTLGVACAREHNFGVRSRLGPVPMGSIAGSTKGRNHVVALVHTTAQAGRGSAMSVSQPAFVRPSAFPSRVAVQCRLGREIRRLELRAERALKGLKA